MSAREELEPLRVQWTGEGGVSYQGWVCFARYSTGEIAIRLADEKGALGTATVALVQDYGKHADPGVKSYGVWLKDPGTLGQAGLNEALQSAGVLRLTDRRYPYGGFGLQAQHAQLSERAIKHLEVSTSKQRPKRAKRGAR